MSISYYSEGEDIIKEESINNYAYLFYEYENNPPNLEEALKSMFINSNVTEERAEYLTKDIKTTIERFFRDKDIKNKMKQKYPNLTVEEGEIICSYTCECTDKNFSPYIILNRNLASENREKGLKIVSKYFFIFLKTLRKLPRYYPNNNPKLLYRCIKKKVQLTKLDIFPKVVPYVTNNKKNFLGFFFIITWGTFLFFR